MFIDTPTSHHPLQDMRHSIGEELDRCEEELDREERLGGRGRRSATTDFRDTLAGYRWGLPDGPNAL